MNTYKENMIRLKMKRNGRNQSTQCHLFNFEMRFSNINNFKEDNNL